MYRRVDGIAVDQRVDVPPGPWDDCFVNFEPVVAMVHDVTLRLTSDCTDWVVYNQPPHATCIEPQSGPPDAVNIRPDVLESGQTTSRWFKIALTA
jgi:aldose 1-epimerase